MPKHSSNLQTRRGAVLIVAMIIIFALASMLLVLGQSMRVEATTSANELGAAEARIIARGAEQYVLSLVTESTEPLESLSEATFAAVPVGTGYFWLVRPDYNDPTLPAYGLVDESSKLDLNRAPVEVLARMPGMTDAIAAAVVDWRDAYETITSQGAESETYLQKATPYRAKNEPFESVEELLLVNDMTRDLLYGQPGGGTAIAGQFASELYQTQGLFNFFTVWGKPAAAVASDGTQKLNPNDMQGREQFRAMLVEQLGQARGSEVGNQLGEANLRSLLHFAARTGLKSSELKTLEPYVDVRSTPQPGQPPAPEPLRVNINAAPREVLMTVTALSETDADTLIAQRPAPTTSLDDAGSIAWVIDALGAGNSEKLTELGDQVTGRGGCWSAEILAASGNGRAFCRVRMVVDATGSTPVVLYRRDITDRGWPLDPGILQSLRSGAGI